MPEEIGLRGYALSFDLKAVLKVSHTTHEDTRVESKALTKGKKVE